MLKSRILLWYRISNHKKPMKWSPFFTTPAHTDAILRPLFEPAAPDEGVKKESSAQNPRIQLLLWLLILIAATFLLSGRSALAINPSDSSISRLRSEALEAEGSGEFDRAESFYQMALSAAEQSASKTKIVEFLSRIVQVRIENHKLLQTDALVQQAIQLAQSLKNTRTDDSTLPVWMNDMADAFYSAGEHTVRDEIKEYCLKRYLDIKFSMADNWDPLLICKSNLLTTYLQFEGRYLEALPYIERATAYIQQRRSNEIIELTGAYQILGGAYLLAHNPIQAEVALKRSLALKETSGKDIIYEGIIERNIGTAEVEQGHIEAARAHYQHALSIHEQSIGKATIHTGWDRVVLGMLEERAGNVAEAARLFRASLDCFDKCLPPEITSINSGLHPDGLLYSGQVISAEHLAEVALKQGNVLLARTLQARAKNIRSRNPYWATTSSKTPDDNYVVSGQLPWHIDVICTRADRPI